MALKSIYSLIGSPKKKRKRKSKSLTVEQQQELGKKIIRAKEKLNHVIYDVDRLRLLKIIKKYQHTLIETNYGIVNLIAKNYHKAYNETHSIDELFQQGVLGLFRALKNYDPSKNVSFTHYSTWWVRVSIYNYLSENINIVHVPAHVKEKVNKLKKLDPSKLTKDDKMKFIYFEPFVSLHQQNEEGFEYIDMIKSQTVDSSESLLKQDAFNLIEKHIANLNPREKDFILRNYGINYDKEYTLAEIGQEYKLCRERVRQISNVALKKLKRSIMSDLIKNNKKELLKDLVGQY